MGLVPMPRHKLALQSWTRLNEFLLTARPLDCLTLLDMEMVNVLPRPTFIRRINSRYRAVQKTAERRAR